MNDSPDGRAERGSIFGLQHFCTQDGPGIRTTVFLQGCPLSCAWCHNPEGISPRGGRDVTVREIVSDLVRDRRYYDASGGGVTFSGGEPTLQPGFLLSLLQSAKAEGLRTAVETSGYCGRDVLTAIAPCTDLFLFDFKLADAEKHARYVGAHPARILDNLRYLCELRAHIRLRCPVIPGVNDDEQHFAGIAAAVRALGDMPVEVLPYHNWGEPKVMRFGLAQRPAFAVPAKEQVACWRKQLGALGLTVVG